MTESKGVPYNLVSDNLKEVTQAFQIPKEGYVIQFHETRQVAHEGDDRSKRCPGHGYPAYTETIRQIRQFVTIDAEEWKKKLAEIYRDEPDRNDVVAFRISRARIDTSVRVDVD